MQLREFEWTLRSRVFFNIFSLQQIQVKFHSISAYLIFREQSL